MVMDIYKATATQRIKAVDPAARIIIVRTVDRLGTLLQHTKMEAIEHIWRRRSSGHRKTWKICR